MPRGVKRKIDDNGFLTCAGAPDAGQKPHRAHISDFYVSGATWWVSPDGYKHGRPGSYCRTCTGLRYWKGRSADNDDLVYDSATVMDLQRWASQGDKRADDLYRQWREDLKAGLHPSRLI